MASLGDSRSYHETQASLAATYYLASINPKSEADDWHQAVIESRELVLAALRSTGLLRSIEAGLQAEPALTPVLRSLTAPPISQDQFKLKCPAWNKRKEREELPLGPAEAAAFAVTFELYRDKQLTSWIDRNRNPSRREIRELLRNIAPHIALQRLGTARRNRLARAQEQTVIEMLEAKGWKRVPSKLVSVSASLGSKEYSHKTKFATSTLPQEVDIACGLKNTVVLAMECKVTNDKTNSVKRVNDVLKKASAWKTHWGSFVKPAALLQGVIKFNDVNRLLESDVHVFWTHDLKRLDEWLAKQI